MSKNKNKNNFIIVVAMVLPIILGITFIIYRNIDRVEKPINNESFINTEANITEQSVDNESYMCGDEQDEILNVTSNSDFFVIDSSFEIEEKNLITYVDLTQAVFGIRNAEEIFKDFEFVPLELHRDGLLIFEQATFYLTDKYIIGMNFLGPAYLFDRKTGVFIREISSRGRGPDEYIGRLYNR